MEIAVVGGTGTLGRLGVAALAERGHHADGLTAPGTALTARERQVLDLTAAGLDVNEVAQRLFLTPGTVRGVLELATAHARG